MTSTGSTSRTLRERRVEDMVDDVRVAAYKTGPYIAPNTTGIDANDYLCYRRSRTSLVARQDTMLIEQGIYRKCRIKTSTLCGQTSET